MDKLKNTYEVLRDCKVNVGSGLSAYEANQRLLKDGPNELLEKKKASCFQLFVSQLMEPMVLILIIAAILSMMMKEFMDVIMIIIVVICNAIIGVIQEYKAEKAMEALKQLTRPKAIVKRDGILHEVEARELVIGDIVYLEAGNRVPADLRLIESRNLKVEESLLTGESEPVEKFYDWYSEKEVSIQEQKNMAFMSTFVTYGNAIGVVVACGMNSEVGKVAKILTDTKEEKTPLQKRLAQLSKILGIGAIVICILMFLIGLIREANVLDMLMLSISLAVAAIPEGLPAVVTIVLALGMQRMSKHHAIIRKLHAVETLGSVSVICSDKTGTLTQNKMKVEQVYCNSLMNEPSKNLLLGFALCNEVHIQDDSLIGEPTETALVQYALQYGYQKDELLSQYIKINEISFDSVRKMMTTQYRYGKETIAFTKGAVEKLIERSTKIEIDGIIQSFTSSKRDQVLSVARKMSEQAYRTIAIAMKKGNSNLEEDLIFIGLVGMIDPPRQEAKEAIEICHKAGISVRMITGDHPLTALAIARKLNIAKQENEVCTGSMLEDMDDEELMKKLKNYHVFARVTPSHKVRIVELLQKQGEVVAMSGDGVNDAPSVKKADIGIAMGKGSDVCKQASDLILSDDNFSLIVRAVEEGRTIYANIRKAVLYLLSCNLGEIVALFLSVLLMPKGISVLCAIQILWVNMVTDALPALALGVDPMDRFVMEDQPRSVKESLFAHGGGWFTVLNGLLIGTMTLVAFRYGMNRSLMCAQTMAFMVLSISQLFHALNLTSFTHSMFEVGLGKNRWLLFTVVFGVLLQVLVVILPPFRALLKTVLLMGDEWVVVMMASSIIIVVNEISKWIAKGNE